MLLSNGCPFHGTTEDELIEKIFAAKVEFDKPIWENVSSEAKTLIKKLLNVRQLPSAWCLSSVNSRLIGIHPVAGPCKPLHGDPGAQPPVDQVELPASATGSVSTLTLSHS